MVLCSVHIFALSARTDWKLFRAVHAFIYGQRRPRPVLPDHEPIRGRDGEHRYSGQVAASANGRPLDESCSGSCAASPAFCTWAQNWHPASCPGVFPHTFLHRCIWLCMHWYPYVYLSACLCVPTTIQARYFLHIRFAVAYVLHVQWPTLSCSTHKCTEYHI